MWDPSVSCCIIDDAKCGLLSNTSQSMLLNAVINLLKDESAILLMYGMLCV